MYVVGRTVDNQRLAPPVENKPSHVGVQAALGGFRDGHSAALGADNQVEV